MLLAFTRDISPQLNGLQDGVKGAMDAFKSNLEQSKESLAEVASKSLLKFTDAVNSVSETAEKTKVSLEGVMQQAEKLNTKISGNLQNIVSDSVNQWTHDHPVIAWAIIHPLLFLGLTILTFFLLRLTLGAIADLIQEALKDSLKRGGKQIFRLLPQNNSDKSLELSQDEQGQSLIEILQRLEAIRKEQDELLSELRLIAISARIPSNR